MLETFRRVMNSIRLVIAIVVLVPCALMIGAFAVWQWWSGSGTMHVVASPGETVTVSVDGSPPETVFENQHWRRELPQGTHHVVVAGALGQTQMDVSVSNGFWSGLVPTSPSQCWAEVDATHFYFGSSRQLPTVIGRYPATATISVGGDYLSEAELPASIDSRSSLHMLVPMSCGMMNFPDAQLIDALGYRF